MSHSSFLYHVGKKFGQCVCLLCIACHVWHSCIIFKKIEHCIRLFSFFPGMWIKTALYCALAPTLLVGNLEPTLFETLYACQHGIFFAARLPQIYENFQTKSTGQLSFMTNFMSFAGCVVRTFTSIQENAPTSMLVGCLLGLLTNGVVCAQIAAYAPKPEKVKKVE